MSKSIRELSIALLFVTIAGLAISGAIGIRTVYLDYKTFVEREAKTQEEVLESANAVSELVTELGVMFGVRWLQAEQIIEPAMANKISQESVNLISKKSQRLGWVLQSVHDKIVSKGIR